MKIVGSDESYLELCLHDGDPELRQVVAALGLPGLDLFHVHIIGLQRRLDSEKALREIARAASRDDPDESQYDWIDGIGKL